MSLGWRSPGADANDRRAARRRRRVERTGPRHEVGASNGKQELFARLGRLAELTGGTLRGEIHDVLASDDHVLVLQTTRGERDGHGSLEDREAIVLHVRDGTVVEVWEHPGDVYAMDAFFS